MKADQLNRLRELLGRYAANRSDTECARDIAEFVFNWGDEILAELDEESEGTGAWYKIDESWTNFIAVNITRAGQKVGATDYIIDRLELMPIVKSMRVCSNEQILIVPAAAQHRTEIIEAIKEAKQTAVAQIGQSFPQPSADLSE